MLKSGVLALLATVSIVVFASPMAQAEGLLSWKFKKGDTLRYAYQLKTQTQSKGTGKITSGPSESDLRLLMELTWEVQQVQQDGTATIIQKIDYVALTVTRERQPALNYDSNEPVDNNEDWAVRMDEAFRPMIREPFTIKLSAQGRLIDLKLPKNTKRSWDDKPWIFDGSNLYFPLFSKIGHRSLLTIMLPELPIQEVGKTAAWSHTWNQRPYQFRLEDSFSKPIVKGDVVQFTAKTEATPMTRKNAPLMMPWPLSFPPLISFDGDVADYKFDTTKLERNKGETTLSFDAKAGRLIELTRDLDYDTNMDFREKENAPKTGTLICSFRLNASMKLIK